MVLTIFRKDFRLLWPGVIAVTVLQAALAGFEVARGPFGDSHDAHNFNKLLEMEQLLEGVVLAGIALLISIVVHQDALPQIDLDWLIRPLKRWQLAAAKLVFFGACIQAPMFAFDVIGCLAGGFDISHALTAALSRNLFFLVGLTIPAFSIAAVTRNVIEFVIGIGLLVAIIEILDRSLFYFFDITLMQSVFRDHFDETNWVLVMIKYLVITIGSASILALQYGRRKTNLSRPIFAAFVVVGFAASYLPWQVSSKIDERVSGGSPIDLSFDTNGARILTSEEGLRFRLPIRVSNLPAGAELVMDLQEGAAKVAGRSFEGFAWVIYQEGGGPWLSTRLNGSARAGFFAPGVTLEQIKDWPAADLSLDLSVTMVEKQGDDLDFPASEDYAPLPKLGQCRITDPGRRGVGMPPLVAECAQAGQVAGVTMMSAFVPGRAEPFATGMTPFGYSPFFAQFLPDAIHRLSVGMVPRTETPTTEFYPHSHVVMRNYRALSHRQVHLVLKQVRLQDWGVEPEKE